MNDTNRAEFEGHVKCKFPHGWQLDLHINIHGEYVSMQIQAMFEAWHAARANSIESQLDGMTSSKARTLAAQGMKPIGVVMLADDGKRATIDMGRVTWTGQNPDPATLPEIQICTKSQTTAVQPAQAGAQKCSACNGNGEVGGPRQDGYHAEECPFCQGSGREDSKTITQPLNADHKIRATIWHTCGDGKWEFSIGKFDFKCEPWQEKTYLYDKSAFDFDHIASAGKMIAEATRDDRVDDLSMLVRRLVHALSKAAPDHTLPAKAMDYLQRKGLQGSPLRDEAVKRDDVAEDASVDECIGLAQALEQARAVKIAEAVAALPIGDATNDMPTPFQSGFQLACEEITHRLRTEEWDLCLRPIDAAIAASKEAQ